MAPSAQGLSPLCVGTSLWDPVATQGPRTLTARATTGPSDFYVFGWQDPMAITGQGRSLFLCSEYRSVPSTVGAHKCLRSKAAPACPGRAASGAGEEASGAFRGTRISRGPCGPLVSQQCPLPGLMLGSPFVCEEVVRPDQVPRPPQSLRKRQRPGTRSRRAPLVPLTSFLNTCGSWVCGIRSSGKYG